MMDTEKHENGFRFGAHGQHQAWSEEPDIVHLVWSGDVSPDDIASGARVFERMGEREHGLYLVIHAETLGRVSPEARKAITSDPRSGWARQVFIVGASFQARVVLGMISKAVLFLGIGKVPMIFASSEQEVRPLIEDARRRARRA